MAVAPQHGGKLCSPLEKSEMTPVDPIGSKSLAHEHH